MHLPSHGCIRIYLANSTDHTHTHTHTPPRSPPKEVPQGLEEAAAEDVARPLFLTRHGRANTLVT